MTERLPLPWGSRLDRARRIRFRFDGQPVEGLAGDTIASALAGAGRWILSRSFKYHRPRGVLTMAGQDANTLVQLPDEPNVRADLRAAIDGMQVTAQNVSGTAERDRGAVLDRLGRFMPVGFYYRSFFRPGAKSWLKFWEPIIRRSAGLGKVDPAAAPGHYVRENLHTDVLVVGAGPAGLSAAVTAAEAGASVLLVDLNPELGGALTYARFGVDNAEAQATLNALRAKVEALPNIQVMTQATCNGWFADNFLPVLQGDRLYRVRAKQVVVAAGSQEQPLVFRNNDLPGILLSSAAQRLMRHYAVRPGRRAVVFAGNRDGYLAALDLAEAGVTIAAVLDPAASPAFPDLAQRLIERKLRIVHSATVTEAVGAAGNRHVRAVRFTTPGSAEQLDCDHLVIAAGYTPAYQLPLHAGAKLNYDEARKQFVLHNLPDGLHIAGSAAGFFDLHAVLRSGEAAGAKAAKLIGCDIAQPEPIPDPIAPGMNHFHQLLAHPKGRDFVDFDEDLQVKDIRNAVADGYRELELVKRYSTVGMGPSQGRHSALTTARIVAAETGRTVGEVGITTSRPPFGPEKLGLLAGPNHVPYRQTPMHAEHVAAGAKLTPAGAWWRPLHYAGQGDVRSKIADEVALVRNQVGMLDVSTLGKLAIRGTDAAAFVDRIYTMAHLKQPVGRVRYCLMLNDMGSVIDDGVAYRLSETEFYVTATTGAVARVFSEMLFLNAQWRMQVDIQNVTAAFAAVNVTGPSARKVLEALGSDIDLSSEGFPYLNGRSGVIGGCPVRIMRIGFTGELSYELHVPQSFGGSLWRKLLEVGAPHGLKPYGLEASRILRLEKGHIIIGQDTDALSTPDELAMGWALSKTKQRYVGKTAIEARGRLGLKRRLCGFELPEGHGIRLAESCLVLRDGRPVGFVTSTFFSPTLGKWIGLAYADPRDAAPGSSLRIRGLCGREIVAKAVATPFYDPENHRQEM
ncbi:FAD-dependent oxidoreductase [Mesorhizobium sp. CU2]|uniref:2Fe-2S iron-sulfur cluster-binding protein n=1 Tax=unclassified Mesorhizobium TaxID=325217 RepID=UPI00112CEBBF|nr:MULTISPECIES: 2Fe-2S iron-sulfur cluster-binding protein [unclassified Mesorhizobium]TPN89417.1 FAD-dependent oxidoreductase [Mesorhizobium sp. CU3]TPO22219.1 FAD-dependent oxidoreductase [Mesorhizobium sp. CU2]